MKSGAFPYFHITGTVSICERGESHSIVRVVVGGYVRTHDECYGLLLREAKYKLELLGLSKERVAELFFEDQDITDIKAVDAKGVKRDGCDRPEAFFDWYGIAKRDTLIRQRRIVPQDHTDMVAIYGPKPAPADHAEPIDGVHV